MKEMLRQFLDAQRGVVLAILDGLDDTQLTTAVLPSGWTPAAMVEHLGYAERYWFEEVMTGAATPLPWDEDPPPLTTPRPPAVVFEFYRAQQARSDAVIAATPLDAPPKVRDPRLDVTDLGWVLLHMIEETARHAGHLDAARELLDGVTGRGPR